MRSARSTPRRSASARRKRRLSARRSGRSTRNQPSAEHQVNVVARDRAEEIDEGVVLDVAGFDFASRFAAALDGRGGAIDYAVDDVAIDAIIEQIGRNPEERARDQMVVELVDVVFAPEQLAQAAQALRDASGQRRILDVEYPRQEDAQQS